MNRLTVYTPFPRDAVLLTLLYLDRITRQAARTYRHLEPAILLPQLVLDSARAIPIRPLPPLLNAYTKHRLLLSVLLVTAKYISDGFIPQPRAAKVGGIGIGELVRLEVDALACLSWDLSFTLEQLEELAKIFLQVGEEAGLIEKASTVEKGTPAHAPTQVLGGENRDETRAADGQNSDEEAKTTPQAPSTPVPVTPLPLVPPLQPPPSDSSNASALSSESSSASASPSLLAVDRHSPAPSSPPSSTGYQSEDDDNSHAAKAINIDVLTSRASSDTVRDLGLDRLTVAA